MHLHLISNLRLGLCVPIALASLLPLVGCGARDHALAGSNKAPAKPAPLKAKGVPAVRPSGKISHRANELGEIPILEYHHIEAKEDRWTRTPAAFRKDLERLHRLGYRPISLMNYVNGKIDLPEGRSGVIFTFDDSDPGQFRYLGSGATAKLDPNCAVAMMQAFEKAHPDFRARATFFVLPMLFGQKEFRQRKMQELRKWGFEIGNHTWSHPQLRHLSADAGRKEIAKGVGLIHQSLPGYDVQSMALPYGSTPHDESILRRGSVNGVRYSHAAVVLAGANPALSPFAKRFDPYRLPRIQGTETAQPSFAFWLNELEKHPSRKFRSDGDSTTITYPKALKRLLRPTVVKSRRVLEY